MTLSPRIWLNSKEKIIFVYWHLIEWSIIIDDGVVVVVVVISIADILWVMHGQVLFRCFSEVSFSSKNRKEKKIN